MDMIFNTLYLDITYKLFKFRAIIDFQYIKFNIFDKKNILSGVPIPNPCFLDDCEPLGAFNGQRRWRSSDYKRLYTWDSFHGEIEIFNRRGKHLGVLDPQGKFIKDAIKGRTIDV
nr:colicin E3/pyocin S6 family cytotoxin [uncultured Flavobacterium sp.]